MGNWVTCADVDEARVADLTQGRIPIYEPGLAELIANARESGLIEFTTDLPSAIKDADYIFNAVGTPPQADGSVDLSAVLQVAQMIGEHLEDYAVIVNKSTVPVGTGERVKKLITSTLVVRGCNIEFDVVSNPEFLKEGAALSDFMGPDRVIIGADTERARRKMYALYSPYLKKSDRMMYMGLREAELTKYAANAMLATRVSFMNEMANLCDKLQVDVEQVRRGIGSDTRIGNEFLYPGCGYGGSCFPKDVQALMYAGREVGVNLGILAEVESCNANQKKILFQKLSGYFSGEIEGKRIAIWGLAFKPGTDDMREAPSLQLIKSLVSAGAEITAYDPKANQVASQQVEALNLYGRIDFFDDQYSALEGVDALVLVTEWKRFRSPDFAKIRDLMRGKLIVDGRNQYEPDMIRDAGFDYIGMGRSTSRGVAGSE